MQHGKLLLKARRQGARTIIADQIYHVPLQAMPAFAQDDDHTAFVYLLNPSGGILAGDRLEIDVEVERQASILLATPSATKVYRSDGPRSVQVTRLRVAAEGWLEYLPDALILFAEADFEQHIQLDVVPGAVAIVADLVAPGRLARGERFAYRRYGSSLTVRREGSLLLQERYAIEPAILHPDSVGVLGALPYVATVIAYAAKIPPGLPGEIEQAVALHDRRDVACGASLPVDDLIVVRVLARDNLVLEDAVAACWNILRQALLGKPAVQLRRF